LEPIFEAQFWHVSYRFRPGRRLRPSGASKDKSAPLRGIVNRDAIRLDCSVPDVGWVVLVGARMKAGMQRAAFRESSSSYFRAMVQRCQAKAASVVDPDDQAYWLGLAQIWSKLAERENRPGGMFLDGVA
jgi:hypothetical protein